AGDQSSGSQQVLLGWRAYAARLKGNFPLGHIDSDAGIDKRVIDCRVNDSAEINAIAAANGSLAVTVDIISKPNPRTPVVLVANAVAGLRQGRVNTGRNVGRILLILITHSEVQGKARIDPPVVLNEKVVIIGGQGQSEYAQALIEITGVTPAAKPAGAAVAC